MVIRVSHPRLVTRCSCNNHSHTDLAANLCALGLADNGSGWQQGSATLGLLDGVLILAVHVEALVHKTLHSTAELESLRTNFGQGITRVLALLGFLDTLPALVPAQFLDCISGKLLLVAVLPDTPAHLTALAIQLCDSSTIKESSTLQQVTIASTDNKEGCQKAQKQHWAMHGDCCSCKSGEADHKRDRW